MITSTPLRTIGAPATRALEAAGYDYLEDLGGVSRRSLLTLHGVGPRAIRILGEALTLRGMAFAD